METNYLQLAERNQKRAWEIVEDTRMIEIWQSIGAEINQVGSLRTGLLMKHRDIDFHIYSDPITVSESFDAMRKLAENPRIKRIEYANLIDTEEECIEWHAWYEDVDCDLWQLDMIHMRKRSFFDGQAEKVLDRITELMTPELKQTILRLKYETPDDEKIMGIEYYHAVIGDGVRTYPKFTTWRKEHPVTGIDMWLP